MKKTGSSISFKLFIIFFVMFFLLWIILSLSLNFYGIVKIHFLLMIFAAICLVFYSITIILIRKIIFKPINKIITEANAAVSGNMPGKTIVEKYDELGYLNNLLQIIKKIISSLTKKILFRCTELNKPINKLYRFLRKIYVVSNEQDLVIIQKYVNSILDIVKKGPQNELTDKLLPVVTEMQALMNNVNISAKKNKSNFTDINSIIHSIVIRISDLQKLAHQYMIKQENYLKTINNYKIILRQKVVDALRILEKYSVSITSTGKTFSVGRFALPEYCLGNQVINAESLLVNELAKELNVVCSFYQLIDDFLILVSTTMINLSGQKVIGHVIKKDEALLDSIKQGGEHFQHMIMINNWYYCIFQPFFNSNDELAVILALALPETSDLLGISE